MLANLKILGNALAFSAAAIIAMIIGVVVYFFSMALWFIGLGAVILGLTAYTFKEYWENRK